MLKKAKKASIPIESEDSGDISESQKKHYEGLGYKPYLSHGGKIRWLSYEQHTYETIKYSSKKKLFSFKVFKPKTSKNTRLYKSWIKILLSHWVFLLLGLIIISIMLNLNSIMDLASMVKF